MFCDQNKISGKVGRLCAGDVIDACERALDGAKDGDIFELAFFGGSFTAINRDYMDMLLGAAYPYVQSGKIKGIRISTRPDCINEEILEHLKSFGVSAIELGAQSMDDEVLALARRGHTAEDVEKASKLIKRYDFSLGLQMMTGLPGDTNDKAYRTAQKIAFLRPDTVRIYPAIVIKNTALADMYNRGEYCPQTLSQAVELCAMLLEFFERKNSIPVIKLGLQHESSLDEGYVAGPYHPAFRELCEGARYLCLMRDMLGENIKNRKLTFYVPPRMLSKAIGQRKCNIRALAADGYTVEVKPDSDIDDIRLEVGEII